ncbi:triple tyrosine motif-containing protein [Peribacillus butanolivorans]|uniref:triple tyrosine motif-containing protein n=1 Tax=Peribacillus butanolivorans TaxID=421767 RepID=UPI00346AF797
MKRSLIMLLVMLSLVVAGCGKDTPKETKNEESKKVSNSESKEKPPRIKGVTLEQVNDDTLEVKSDATGENLQYSFYIFKDDEILEKIPYKSTNHLSYTVKEPGKYMVRVYVKNSEKNIVTANTDKIDIDL